MRVISSQQAEKAGVPEEPGQLAFWEKMADLVPGIIYVFNHQTMSNEYSNRSINDFLGYSPEEVLQMGDNLLNAVVHPEDHVGLFGYLVALRDLPEGGEACHEYRARAKNGEIRWLRSADSVLERDAHGSVIRHFGIALDITMQKQAEMRLREIHDDLEARVQARTAELEVLNSELGACMAARTAELEDVNRDLKDLTYIATHDLKVPVNNMTSLTHMLSEAEPFLPPEHTETLGWMRDVCHQASEKLDALICVAQAHSGVFADFRTVNLAAVTEAALVNLHFQISRAKAVVTHEFEAPSVYFVQREMENILQSMIGNAIKYQYPGRRPRVHIMSRALEDCVEITIRDNGTGLDLARDEEKVFGLFKRAHSTPEGAGVSLYSIRRVLDRAGGTIEVTSTPGEGSCFSLRLPHEPEAS